MTGKQRKPARSPAGISMHGRPPDIRTEDKERVQQERERLRRELPDDDDFPQHVVGEHHPD